MNILDILQKLTDKPGIIRFEGYTDENDSYEVYYLVKELNSDDEQWVCLGLFKNEIEDKTEDFIINYIYQNILRIIKNSPIKGSSS